MPVTKRVFDRYPTTKTENNGGFSNSWEVLSASEAAGKTIRIDSVIMMSPRDGAGDYREVTLEIGGTLVAIAPPPVAAGTYSVVVLHELWSDGESINFVSANVGSPTNFARATITYSIL